MPTQTEIAKRWDLSKMRVCQLVKEGMPTATFRAADRWRANRALRREPTNGKWKQESLAVRDCGIGNLSEKEIQARIAKLNPPAKTGDSLLDMLNSAWFMAKQAFNAYIEASQRGSVNTSARLSEHCKATKLAMKAETAYRVELERRGILVDKHVAMQESRMAIEAVVRRLKRLPIEVGPQCNPGNPLLATKVLEREVASILAAGAKAIHDLRANRNLEEPHDWQCYP